MDQVMSSGSNFLLMFLIAQRVPTDQFGIFVILYGLLTVALAVTRSAVGVPLGMDLPRASRAQRSSLVSEAGTLAVLIGIVTAIALGVFSLVLSQASLRSVGLLLAAACPVIALQDVWRFAAIADGRPQLALLADTVWAVLALSALSWGASTHQLSAMQSVSIWVVGALLAAIVLVLARVAKRPCTPKHLYRLLVEDRRRHLAIDAVVASFAPVLVASGVALVAGPDVTGATRGAAAVMSPLNVLIAAIPLTVIPEAARRTGSAAISFVAKVSMGLVALAAMWGILVYFAPSPVGRALLGPTWAVSIPLVPVTALEYAALAAWSGATTLLRVQGRTRVALKIRIAHAGGSLSGALVAASALGRPIAVSTTLAVIAVAIAAVAWSAATARADAAPGPRNIRRQETSTSRPDPGGA